MAGALNGPPPTRQYPVLSVRACRPAADARRLLRLRFRAGRCYHDGEAAVPP